MHFKHHRNHEKPELPSSSRMEAFSDGVIAIIVTIMVLELKVPHEQSFEALAALWPVFASYLISFIFVAIYWVNHHSLLSNAKRVDSLTLWSNNLLLFCLSLIPFTTAYMGETRVSSFTTMIYGVVQFACALSFSILAAAISRAHPDVAHYRRVRRSGWRKNLVSLILYAAAIPAAYVSPSISIAIFAGIGLIYTVPRLFVWLEDDEASGPQP